MSERVNRLTEGVEIIRRLWTEDRVVHKGRHWQLDGVSIRPRPLQQPRPPILVGSQVEAGIARAGRIADGWLVVPLPTVQEFAKQASAFAAARAAAGLPPSAHVCRLLEVFVAPDEATAVARAAPFLLEKYAAYMSWGLRDVAVDPAAAPEDQLRRLAADRFAIGSPAQVVEMLVRQHGAGATHTSMRVSWPGMPHAHVMAGIELLGRAVLPEVRRRTLT
jgi:alkanesulfonate monooxygenase SsuD/methylene tetrahydromethanopterin reductase-like flavin-dependent oxidoreductase (luciferase family)